ncbi:hypothetical protein SARC_07776, partial [Sphaeroforma arctica JP610]
DADKSRGEIHLSIHYTDSEDDIEVPDTYFPMRENGKCYLYQDAHHEEGELPVITRSDGKTYAHGKCWMELYDHLMAAESFIYITGWSVWTEVVLVRGEGVAPITLGEIIKKKAGEGVKVCMLVWNEKTTKKGGKVELEGMMGTHDEETNIYFADMENVKCKLASRYHSHGKFTQFCFTHHQKSVIMDAPSHLPGRRRTISYMGGLDLCDGR